MWVPMSENSIGVLRTLVGQNPRERFQAIGATKRMRGCTPAMAEQTMRRDLDLVGPSEHDLFRALNKAKEALGGIDPQQEPIRHLMLSAAQKVMVDYARENDFTPAGAEKLQPA